ncbi:adenylosuccinate lyase [candidate division WOR-1 bacterium RIFOXYA2_FULL_36_21]|nr:MAG: adenylosuccinate lyase [candidate division WOR-1 bacterium RIFOXYA2_FULL_36_21]OGC19000.1 MAG: adenylosuccinate lyase [candidate division WOR-1 bacterium RIFOXYA12_FULL_36_13]
MIDRYTLPKMRDIWSEENKFRKWLEVEIAACEAWTKLKKIPVKSLKTIKTKAGFNLDKISAIEKTVNHDVIAFLTSVSEKVGNDSRFIHMGMTSSDVVDTSLALLMREAGNVIVSDIKELTRILKNMAQKHKNTIMMGRSHGVHAEPMTFGLKLALYMNEMERNLDRMIKAIDIISVGKFSGAVGTYSNIDPKVEELACKTLNIKPARISSQILQRDRHAEYLSSIAIIGGTLEKIALEIRGLQKTEIGEVEEPFKKGQKGSSAMPHKKNPIVCERICGLSRLLRGNAIVAMENIALWHERDISHSSNERVIIPDSTIILDYMLNSMSRVLNDLVVNAKTMRMNIERGKGLIFSQRLLLSIVNKGKTREFAYTLVQDDAMKAQKLNKHLKIVVLGDHRITKILSLKEIEEVFNVRYYLRNVGKIFMRLGIK